MSERPLRLAIAGLALVGAAVASYLIYTRYSGTRLICATGGCETVQRSRYAELVGVPVAVLGLLLYLLLLTTAAARSSGAAVAGATLALGGALFAGYLLVIQLTVIHAVCQWCVVSDVLVLALAALTVVRLRAAEGAARVWGDT